MEPLKNNRNPAGHTGHFHRTQRFTRISSWLFFPIGLFSLVWYLVRVLPKPSRASYPCQQVAAPMAVSFLGILTSWIAAAFAFGKVRQYVRQYRFVVASVFLVLGLASILSFVAFSSRETAAAPGDGHPTGTFTPSDKPNQPIGVAKGIFPGRVAWAHDPRASTFNGSGNWYENQYNNQSVIDSMLAQVVRAVSGKRSVAAAWDTLFRDFNLRKHGVARPYTSGEKIAIKVNLNNNASGNRIDASPHLIKSMLRELVHAAGVAQADIIVFDVARQAASTTTRLSNVCAGEFPSVNYNKLPAAFTANAVAYSDPSITATEVRRLPTFLVEAAYVIDLAILKRHCEPVESFTNSAGQTAVTLAGKNFFGVFTSPAALHNLIRDWYWGMNHYNPIVDLMSNEHLGGKTVLFLLDGLYTGNKHNSGVIKWKMAPFNNDYPKSVFASQDIVALESVGLDFLRAEMALTKNADNYLHEAAQIGSPQSKTEYAGKALGSLGVHEHWNNATDKKYSRNLASGSGIELFAVNDVPTRVLEPASGPDGRVPAVSVSGRNIIVTLEQPMTVTVSFIAMNGRVLNRYAKALDAGSTVLPRFQVAEGAYVIKIGLPDMSELVRKLD